MENKWFVIIIKSERKSLWPDMKIWESLHSVNTNRSSSIAFLQETSFRHFPYIFYVELWAPPKTPIIEGRSQFIQFAIINIHYLRMLVWSHKLENCSSWEECFKHCLNIFECWILTCKNLKTRQSEDPCIAL